jgi:hypothetical protein
MLRHVQGDLIKVDNNQPTKREGLEIAVSWLHSVAL